VYDFVVETKHPHARDELDRRRGGFKETHDFVFRRKDGTELWTIVSGTPLFDERGAYTGVLSMITDVTARKRAEDQARRHEAELAHVARLSTVGEMASILAHELNQPLSAIANYAQGCIQRLAANRGTSETLTEAMTQAAAEAERAGAIVRRIRSFVRKGEAERLVVDANSIVRDAVEFVTPEARRRNMVIRLALGEGLPPTAADKIQIEQVVLNLVRNAFDAMIDAPANLRTVTIGTRLVDSNAICVSVSDTGNGLGQIPDTSVFEPFFTTKPNGLGIGLTISRSIVEAHGGRLWVEPTRRRGATFVFTLPAVRANGRLK
jgi:C4-dicarboxylate-specific signal transduction histidine kinase